jgi:hypothetical protein
MSECASGALWLVDGAEPYSQNMTSHVDFRSDKMPDGREGRRNAQENWLKALMAAPSGAVADLVEGPARRAAFEVLVNRLGFGIAWQLNGGFQGLRALGVPESTIFRKVKAFRESFGVHPDEFEMPGIKINVGEYVQALAKGELQWPVMLGGATERE